MVAVPQQTFDARDSSSPGLEGEGASIRPEGNSFVGEAPSGPQLGVRGGTQPKPTWSTLAAQIFRCRCQLNGC